MLSIQNLQLEALELSGLTYERAFAVDDNETNIKAEFGELTVTKLIEFFYAKVYADSDDWFRLVVMYLIFDIF